MSTLKTVTILHPSSAVNNIVNDASGNVAVGGTLSVGGVANALGVPSTSGNVLTSNGTAWVSSAPSSGGTPSAIGQIPFSTNGSTYTATQKIVQGTAQASTSGTNIDFTSIPSWVKRITVMFNEVSTNGSANWIIQIGSGSVDGTGYNSTASGMDGTGVSVTAYANGYGIRSTSASYAINGIVTLNLLGSNIWVCSGVLSTSLPFVLTTSGVKTLSGALDRVRITTVATDTFDAGSINIMYE
jgi:hypothetical protein